MSIFITAPYGQMSPEIGLLYLVGRYLAVQGHPVSQLACNGIFASCDRDVEFNWRRPVGGCLTCMREQRDFAKWSDIPGARLSEWLSPDDIQRTARWANALSEQEVGAAVFEGVPLFPLIRGTFVNRFGVSDVDSNNKLHDRFLRTLLLSTTRLLIAMTGFVAAKNPEQILVPVGDNFIIKTMQFVLAAKNVTTVMLEGNISKRCIILSRLGTGDQHECPLLIEDVLSLRSDVKTWSPELTRLLKELVGFLQPAALAAPISAIR